MVKNYRPLAILEHEVESLITAELKALEAKSAELDVPESDILNVHEGVGIIEVNGQLTNRNSYWNSLFGLVSYDEVRAACVEAIDLGVNALLFDIDSPGGSVSGMSQVSEFVGSLDIPTVTYSGGQIASAAYYLGASADHLFVDSMTESGSIGVVLKLMDATEAYKKEGLKPIIIRSGSKKAIGGSCESLTPENQKYLQEQVYTYAEKFYSYVSEARGIPRPNMKGIEEGGTYIGEEGVIAGLVDSIKTFDEALLYAISLAQTKEETNNTNDYHNNNYSFSGSDEQGGQVMAKRISKAALAALVNADGAAKPETGAEGSLKPSGEVGTEAVEEVVETVETPEAATETETNVEMVELQEKYDASQIDLAEAATKNEELTAVVEGLTAAADTVTANHAIELSAFSEIIVAQVNTMRTALSLTSIDMSSWSAEAVLVEYNAVSKTFESSLPVGGVVPDEVDDENKNATSRSDESDLKALSF